MYSGSECIKENVYLFNKHTKEVLRWLHTATDEEKWCHSIKNFTVCTMCIFNSKIVNVLIGFIIDVRTVDTKRGGWCLSDSKRFWLYIWVKHSLPAIWWTKVAHSNWSVLVKRTTQNAVKIKGKDVSEMMGSVSQSWIWELLIVLDPVHPEVNL